METQEGKITITQAYAMHILKSVLATRKSKVALPMPSLDVAKRFRMVCYRARAAKRKDAQKLLNNPHLDLDVDKITITVVTEYDRHYLVFEVVEASEVNFIDLTMKRNKTEDEAHQTVDESDGIAIENFDESFFGIDGEDK